MSLQPWLASLFPVPAQQETLPARIRIASGLAVAAVYAMAVLVATGALAPHLSHLGYLVCYASPLLAVLLFSHRLALLIAALNLLLLAAVIDSPASDRFSPLLHGAGILLLNTVLPLICFRAFRALAIARKGLVNSNSLFEDLIQSSGFATALCDPEGRILRVNGELSSIFALSDGAALNGRFLQELLGAPERTPVSVLRPDSEWRIPSPGGNSRYLVVRSQQETPQGQRVVLLGDITAIRQIQRDLRKSHAHTQFLARHDRLTGLPNRDYLTSALESAIETTPHGLVRPLLAVRLVSLRHVNARFGIDEGDRLLARFAMQLRDAAGEGAVVARIRGVVFGVVLPPSPSAAAVVGEVERLRAALPVDVDLAGDPMRLSLAFGLALHEGEALSANELMRQSEEAMDLSRRRGDNLLSVFDAGTGRQLRRRIALEIAFSRALAAHDIHIAYQPKVDARGRLLGFEALARWHSLELGEVNPTEFVTVAEETGWICQLSDFVLDQVCGQIARWQQAGLDPIRVAVNFSARDLERSDLFQTIFAAVSRHGVKPSLLEIEITETCLATQPEQVMRQLRMLHEGGFRIAIDDFGAGYSSLAKLVEMPVSTVKIDRGFLHGLPGDLRRERVVRTIVALARGLSLELVAEGVETVQQFAFLELLGCDVFQGFYFFKPGPAQQWEPLLRAQHCNDHRLATPFPLIAGENVASA